MKEIENKRRKNSMSKFDLKMILGFVLLKERNKIRLKLSSSN
jgi:hypothetical protein